MSRFLSVPFDIQCLTLEHLTLWRDLEKILNLYLDQPIKYRQALSCIKRILYDPSVLLRKSPRIHYSTQLLKMTQVEIVEHLVSYLPTVMQDTESLNDLGLPNITGLQYLTKLSIEFPTDMFYDPNSSFGDYDQFEQASKDLEVIKFITTFFLNLLRQQRGHLIYYIQKLPFYDYVSINNIEDNNFMCMPLAYT